jgi:hypothetical protein
LIKELQNAFHFDKNALIFNIDGCFTLNQICCTIATACILF